MSGLGQVASVPPTKVEAATCCEGPQQIYEPMPERLLHSPLDCSLWQA